MVITIPYEEPVDFTNIIHLFQENIIEGKFPLKKKFKLAETLIVLLWFPLFDR